MVLAFLILFITGSSIAENFFECTSNCFNEMKTTDCILNPPTCLSTCAAKCTSFALSSSPKTDHACNVGCALHQCRNFMDITIEKKEVHNYTNCYSLRFTANKENLGKCMTSCSEAHCATKAPAVEL